MLARILGLLGHNVALDLGTANTRVGVAGRGLLLDEPSVIALDNSTGKIFSGGCAVGFLARQMLGRTPDAISVVRPMLGGVITDFRQCEAMLRYFLRKAECNRSILRPRVLVTVPGCITPVEKRAVFNSVQRAGAGEVLMISKAKAAAIGAGLPVAEPLANMVCDVGGGTTDAAVFSLNRAVAEKSIRTGGDAMDEALAGYLLRRYNLQIGIPAAERLRIQAGSAYPLADEPASEVGGLDAASGLPRKLPVTGEEIRQALEEPLEKIIAAIKTVINGVGAELASDLAAGGMTLCGGGSLLRGIDRFITARTGLPTRTAADPRAAAVQGALVCLEQLDRWRSSLLASDADL